jgi:hypothetical protein
MRTESVMYTGVKTRQMIPLCGFLMSCSRACTQVQWCAGIDSGFAVVRYHSLAICEQSLPAHLEPIAWTCGSHQPLRQAADKVQNYKCVQYSAPTVSAQSWDGLRFCCDDDFTLCSCVQWIIAYMAGLHAATKLQPTFVQPIQPADLTQLPFI